MNDLKGIKRKWSCLSCDHEMSKPSASTTDEEFSQAKKFINRIEKKWSTTMNLYTHNCQHFSYFVTDLLKEEEICLL